jgi:hypothetical protein
MATPAFSRPESKSPEPPKPRRRKPSKNQKIVFGHDVKLDVNNRPIEQGIGSSKQLTLSHWEARLKNAVWNAKYFGTDTAEEVKACQAGIAAAKLKAEATMVESEEYEDEEEDF